jgi:hypothetical protein
MARNVFGSYRRDEFADPEAFLIQFGAVLERYPDHVIREITHPATGIQRKCKFPPTIAEVVEACDNEVARLARMQRYHDYGQTSRYERPRMGCIANVLVLRDAPQYAAMAERSRKATSREFRHDDRGIWVPLGWLSKQEAKADGFRRFTREELEAIYRRNEGRLEGCTEQEVTPWD